MHRRATQAKIILERMERRHRFAGAKDDDGGAYRVEKFSTWDLREVRKAIALLEGTDLRTRVDPSRRKSRKGRR